jgi:hypothetical protein
MSSITNLSIQQLRQAADLKERIASLEKQLGQLLGSTKTVATAPKKKKGISAAGRARIAAAAKARWAKIKAAKPQGAPAKTAKKKGGMSAAGRARIAAAAKARWAKAKAAGKKSL